MNRPAPSSRNEPTLTEAVFRSVYGSRAQRRRRLAAGLLLTAKHGLRGLLFSWPVYLLAVAGIYASGWLRALLWVIALPGVGLSLLILQRGIREEYQSRVNGRLLQRGALRRLLQRGAP